MRHRICFRFIYHNILSRGENKTISTVLKFVRGDAVCVFSPCGRINAIHTINMSNKIVVLFGFYSRFFFTFSLSFRRTTTTKKRNGFVDSPRPVGRNSALRSGVFRNDRQELYQVQSIAIKFTSAISDKREQKKKNDFSFIFYNFQTACSSRIADLGIVSNRRNYKTLGVRRRKKIRRRR